MTSREVGQTAVLFLQTLVDILELSFMEVSNNFSCMTQNHWAGREASYVETILTTFLSNVATSVKNLQFALEPINSDVINVSKSGRYRGH